MVSRVPPFSLGVKLENGEPRGSKTSGTIECSAVLPAGETAGTYSQPPAVPQVQDTNGRARGMNGAASGAPYLGTNGTPSNGSTNGTRNNNGNTNGTRNNNGTTNGTRNNNGSTNGTSSTARSYPLLGRSWSRESVRVDQYRSYLLIRPHSQDPFQVPSTFYSLALRSVYFHSPPFHSPHRKMNQLDK